MPTIRDDVFADLRAERDRQVNKEGWDDKHDDEHDGGEMAVAGALYAICDADVDPEAFSSLLQALWPWDHTWWKPKDVEHNLVRAGALIAAELERVRRAKSATEEETP